MQQFTTRPEVAGTFGAVTATHWLASSVGMSILEHGGNAFDAAVATGFMLQLVEPHNNGPGGEVPIIFCDAADQGVKVICGQGVAPANATLDAFATLGLDLVPGSGLLSAVVPGAFDAWMLLLRDYGRFSLRDVLSPVIHYASSGYPFLDSANAVIRNVSKLFNNEWPTSAALYLPKGEVPAAGGLFINPAFAQTYMRILDNAESVSADRVEQIEKARSIFYEGFVAESIDSFCRTQSVIDTSGRRHSGFLTGQDMASWRAEYESPISYDYHDYTVFKTKPWTQGPVFLQQLALLKGMDLSECGPTSADFVHTVTEVSKLAFADRDAFYGDPNFVEVPLGHLLSDNYNSERRKLITTKASLQIRPGRVEGWRDQIPYRPTGTTQKIAYREAIEFIPTRGRRFTDWSEQVAHQHRGDTCHFDVVDKQGNMVSATPSGGWLQSSPVIPDLGWPLTPRAEMFVLDKRSPNALQPGKRPRITLTPSLAFRCGKPYMVFGTPGGDQQDQWALHMFLRHVHHGLDLQGAVDAPEFHTLHMTDSFFPRECALGHLAVEGRFPTETIRELSNRGHDVIVYDDYVFGFVCSASWVGKIIRASASPRYQQAYAIAR